MRWFTSDQHLSHVNIIRYSGRPYLSVDEMNDDLITRHNSIVRPDDEVWWLGDVAMGDVSTSLNLVERFHGIKTLVVGNHERIFSGSPGEAKYDRWLARYEAAGFQVVLQGNHAIELQDGTSVIVSHFPYVGDSQESDRYPSARPVDSGELLLHGHVHEKWRRRGRQINVGVDAWGGHPVSEAELIEIIRQNHDLEPLSWDHQRLPS